MSDPLKQRLAAMGIFDPVALVNSLSATGLIKRNQASYKAIEDAIKPPRATKKHGTRMKQSQNPAKLSPSDKSNHKSSNVTDSETTPGAIRSGVESNFAPAHQSGSTPEP